MICRQVVELENFKNQIFLPDKKIPYSIFDGSFLCLKNDELLFSYHYLFLGAIYP